MRLFSTIVAALMCCLLAPQLVSAQQPKTKKNVLLIIVDDMGLDMECYGNKVIKVPNLNKLAKNGIVFTNAYSTVASCSASRASILTGLYTHQNGQFGHAHANHAQSVHPWVKSLPLLLNRLGYLTGLIGKFHVAPPDKFPFHTLTSKGTKGNRDPVAMANHARTFIREANIKKKPFFLVYSTSDPHRARKGFGNEPFKDNPKEVKYDPKDVKVPYYLPDRPEVREEIAKYYQACSRLDRGVGLLMEILQQSGHLEDTMVIFISDNGIPFPGAKTTLYEPGVHLPLIVSAPGHKQGHKNNALVSYVDLCPTILDWCGGKTPVYKAGRRKMKLPGRSFLPILDQTNPKGWDRVFGSHQFHEITMYYPMRFIRTRKYKLLVNFAHKLDYPFASDLWASPTWQGILKRGDKKMGVKSVEAYLHRPKYELYDMVKDPKELKNLADNPKYAKVRAELASELRRWQRATNDEWTILYREEKEISKK